MLCWIEVVRMDTFVLFLMLEGKLSAFHPECDFSWGLIMFILWCAQCSVMSNSLRPQGLTVACQTWAYHTWALLYRGTILLYLIEYFYHERILNFVKCFFCTYWDDHMIFNHFIYLLIDCAGFPSLCGLFSSCDEHGLLSSCSPRASYNSGSSCCRAQALGPMGFSSCGTWLSSCGSQALEHRLNNCGTWA